MFERADGKGWRARIALAGCGAIMACGAACTALAPSSDSAQTLGISTAASPPPPAPPEWACLNNHVTPVPREPKPVTYIVPIVDFDSQTAAPTPVPGLTITVCPSLTCDTPRLVWGDPGDGGAPGVIMDNAPDLANRVSINNQLPGEPPFVYAITFPYFFDQGSLRLTAPGYAEMDYYLGGPMIGRPEGSSNDGGTQPYNDAYTVLGLAIPLLKETTRSFLYGEIGIPISDGGATDPTRGVLAVRTLNCLRDQPDPQTGAIFDGTRAANVTLQVDMQGPDPLAKSWTLSFQNVATGGTLVTQSRGVAGFINLMPRTYPAQGVAPVAPDAGYGGNSFLVRPNVITLAEIRDGIDQWGQ